MVAVWLYLLLASAVTAQDEEPTDSSDGDEEAWQYVEFLKNDINGKVDDILQNTLYDAKDKRGEKLLEETISHSMDQVMEIRQLLLSRIKDIRKEVIKTDPGQNIRQEKMLSEFRREIMTILLRIIDGSGSELEKLKELGQDLLRLKLSVNNEVMRMLMLPSAGKEIQASNDDCAECEVLDDISYKVENIIVCAEQDDPIEDIDLPTQQEVVTRPSVDGRAVQNDKPEPGTVCVDPTMYGMELINCNDNIDNEIKNLYNKLVIENNDEKRRESLESLDFYKTVRRNIDDVIRKVMEITDATKLKKAVRRSLAQVSNKLSTRLSSCRQECGPAGCESCAAEIIYDSVAKLNDYTVFINSSGDDTASRDHVQGDMIKYINQINTQAKEILTKKVLEENINNCEKEQLEIINIVKQPFWMLVQTAIQGEDVGELEVMIGTLIDLLQQELGNYCGNDDGQRKIKQTEGPKCDWEEYEQTKEYLGKIDEIIQDSLFKDSGEESKLDAILGFVEIQGMLDKRVKKLFEDELTCPDEVSVIKKQYMQQLNKCMAQFMNNKLEFSKMSRIQRISCTKELRNTMENRVTQLLKDELEDTFNQLDTEVPDFLTGEDGPITDIDLPSEQQGVARPQ